MLPDVPMKSLSPLADPAPDADRQALSRLMDGDASADEAATASARWRDDAGLREAWHDYHLIGDVLRSEDLASARARTSVFLDEFRARLQAEPAIVAPTPPLPIRRGRRVARWAGGAAIAAGFMAVAGVLIVSRAPDVLPGADGGAVLAGAPAAADGLRRASVADPASPGAASAAPLEDPRVIRDARIDGYFQAHRGMRDHPAVALPGGAPSNVDLSMPAR